MPTHKKLKGLPEHFIGNYSAQNNLGLTKFGDHSVACRTFPSAVTGHTSKPAFAALVRGNVTSCAWKFADILSLRKYPIRHF